MGLLLGHWAVEKNGLPICVGECQLAGRVARVSYIWGLIDKPKVREESLIKLAQLIVKVAAQLLETAITDDDDVGGPSDREYPRAQGVAELAPYEHGVRNPGIPKEALLSQTKSARLEWPGQAQLAS